MTTATRDKKGRPIIAVTGIGVVTSLGIGKSDNWAKLTAGVSGIRRISRFPTEGLRTTIAGSVDAVYQEGICRRPSFPSGSRASPAKRRSPRPASDRRATFPARLFLRCRRSKSSGRIASRSPKWRRRPPRPAIPTCCASPMSRSSRQFRTRSDTASSARISPSISAPRARRFRSTTACASGATRDPARRGGDPPRRMLDAALAIGADASLTPESLVRFSLLSALSTQNDPPERASKPFSKNRDGFVLAEGAAALVLESLDHARARGARVLGILEGYGEKSDSFHRTRGRARTASRSSPPCSNALADAGVGAEDIDYINAHGTSTPENDKMEHLGVSAVFGERIRGIPISSNKSMIGHTLTAAGAVEAVFTVMTLQSISACRRRSITLFRIRRSSSMSCPMWRATPRYAAPSPIRSASAARTCAWS